MSGRRLERNVALIPAAGPGIGLAATALCKRLHLLFVDDELTEG